MTKWITLSVIAACVCAAFLTTGVAAPKKRGEVKLEAKGGVSHRFLAGSYHGKVYVVDKKGKVEWEYLNDDDLHYISDTLKGYFK